MRTIRRLLLVDDDAVFLRSYRDRLSAQGFQVNAAASGSAAIAALRTTKPDLVVLDLLMPDLTGVDVLRFIRAEPRLAPTPVVVLTNAYLNELGRQAAKVGIEKALLKAQCNPAMLMACIDEILERTPAPSEAAHPSGGPVQPPNPPPAEPPPTVRYTEREAPAAAQPTQAPSPAAPPARAEGPPPRQTAKGEAGTKASADLLSHTATVCADLRKLFQAAAQQLLKGPDQQTRLKELYRRVHYLAAAAGLMEYPQLTQAATVFEALLYVLMEDPSRISPSALRTLAQLVDFVERLFRRVGESLSSAPLSGQVLVVDDDPLSNRLVVTALQQAQLNARSTEDPTVAWQWANSERFDLILLDIEMPGINGFELCKRLRALPGYERIPVIFVTVHSDFESRARSSLSGGDELIAKPILPMELAAKVVMSLLKRQMAA